jgi:hypothetical protein
MCYYTKYSYNNGYNFKYVKDKENILNNILFILDWIITVKKRVVVWNQRYQTWSQSACTKYKENKLKMKWLLQK